MSPAGGTRADGNAFKLVAGNFQLKHIQSVFVPPHNTAQVEFQREAKLPFFSLPFSHGFENVHLIVKAFAADFIS